MTDHINDDGDWLPMPPVGHPLNTLGVLLGRLLDEDQWAECERLLLLGWDQDRIDRKTGADWRTNSSLEVWFPITAEKLKPLTDKQISDLVSNYYKNRDLHDKSPNSIIRAVEAAHGIRDA